MSNNSLLHSQHAVAVNGTVQGYGHAYVTILDHLQWHRVHAWVVGSCSGLAVYIVFICMHCIGINEIDTWVLWGYPLNLN